MKLNRFRIEIVYDYEQSVFFFVKTIEAENEEDAIGGVKDRFINTLKKSGINPADVYILSLNFYEPNGETFNYEL